jgi:hypothetical protein
MYSLDCFAVVALNCIVQSGTPCVRVRLVWVSPKQTHQDLWVIVGKIAISLGISMKIKCQTLKAILNSLQNY